MPGVKLHHPDLKNCVYTLVHEGRPLREPMTCSVCGQAHFHKTYHLALNGSGDVIVSETVFERLKEADLGELQAKTEIKKPPKQTVGMASSDQPTVVSREHGPLNVGA